MAETKIEWTDTTWNPVIGCRHVAEGCRHCYAETMSKRLAAMGKKDYASILDAKGKFNGRAITRPETLAEPLHWKKLRRVFVNSMSDLFHEDVPFEFIAAVFGIMAACPQHTFQVLTKRPERALEFMQWRWRPANVPNTGRTPGGHPARMIGGVKGWNNSEPSRAMADCVSWAYEFGSDDVRDKLTDAIPITVSSPLPNVEFGVSLSDQGTADYAVPLVLRIPAAVRFVSAEPLIEAVNLRELNAVATAVRDGKPLVVRDQVDALGGVGGGPLAMLLGYGEKRAALDWIIVGGESGPSARPCDVAWIRSIAQQCKAAGVPVFVKQLGANPHEQFGGAGALRPMLKRGNRKGGDPAEWPEDLRVREWPNTEPASMFASNPTTNTEPKPAAPPAPPTKDETRLF